MNISHPTPEDATLRSILRECRPAPDLPPGFQDAVWRRIERTEARATGPPATDWLDRLALWVLRPNRAFAAAAALLLLGISLGIASGASHATELAKARYLDSVSPPTLRQ